MSDFRAAAHGLLNRMMSAPDTELQSLLTAHPTPDSVWDVGYPINRLEGVLPGDRKATLDIVEGMLRDLSAFDPETFTSKDQTGDSGYWHEDMLWYGPGASARTTAGRASSRTIGSRFSGPFRTGWAATIIAGSATATTRR